MKKTVLYGAGIQGEKFYARWHKRYDIQFVIDRNANGTFHGLPVFSFEEKSAELKNYYIVVAVARMHYDTISQNLKDIGCIEFDDFIWMDNIDKKLMILYGNCHMAIIERYLNANPNVTKDYIVWRYYVANVDEKYRVPEDRQLRECSVFITQDIQEENAALVPGFAQLKKKLPSDCVSIIVPNVFGCNMFFPQLYKPTDTVNKVNEIHKANLNMNSKLYSSTAVMECIIGQLQGMRDRNIDQLYESGKTVDDILTCILDKLTYSAREVEANFQGGLHKLKARECECSIIISDFIEKNFRHMQLFYEPEHPTNNLLFEYGRRILRYLQIELDETQPVEECLDSGEVFIYESVKEALNMEFEQKFIRRNYVNCTLQNRAMDLREYVVNYIAWNYGEIIE